MNAQGWPLVGRDQELVVLRAALDNPKCGGVMLAGLAGTGKTRLATEGLAIAEAAGWPTARITATHSSSALPFGAVVALLPHSERLSAIDSIDRPDLLHRMISAVRDRAGGRCLVIMVDDAHLLDDASATLIHRMIETRTAFVYATLRVGEPAPSAVTAWWKDELIDRLEVGNLSRHSIEHLLQAVLDGPVDGATSAHFAERCQGNALFLRELILGAREQGTLNNDEGLWRLTGTAPPSSRLKEIVGTRLQMLSAPEREVLELLALAEPLGLREIADVCGVDPEVLEGLEHRILVSSGQVGDQLHVRLAHPLYGAVLRSRIPAMRQARIAKAIADVVERAGGRGDDETLKIATWRLIGGGGSPETMLEAALIAQRRYDYSLAERLARQATALGAGFEADLLLGQLAALQGRGVEAEAQLSALDAQAADDDQRTRLMLARLDNAHVRLRPDLFRQIASDAESVISDPVLRADIEGRRSWTVLMTDGPREALAIAVPLLEQARGQTLAVVCATAARSYAFLGQVEPGVEASLLGERTRRGLASPSQWGPWLHIHMHAEALASGGRFAEAQVLALEEYERALADHSPERQGYLATLLARIAVERGFVMTASRYAQEAIALFGRLDQSLGGEYALIHGATALAMAGHVSSAAQLLERATAFSGEVPLMAAEIHYARGWVAIGTGDLAAALEHFGNSASVGVTWGNLTAAASALHAVGRIGHPETVVVGLEKLSAETGNDLVGGRFGHVLALQRSDPEALGAASRLFEDFGSPLLAAEAAADAATVWMRQGDRRAASAEANRAAGLMEKCEGARTPALQSIEARARLTPSERENAVLASRGHPNKQIAEELHVSVRTVESRLQHTYDKLGVAGRSELAEALEGLGAGAGSE